MWKKSIGLRAKKKYRAILVFPERVDEVFMIRRLRRPTELFSNTACPLMPISGLLSLETIFKAKVKNINENYEDSNLLAHS